MRKLTLALSAIAACSFGSAANAVLVPVGPTLITPSTPSDSFAGAMNCTTEQSPCTFSNSYTFTTPANTGSVNVSVNSVDGIPSTNIDFTNIILNNGTSNTGTFSAVNGTVDTASLLGATLIAGATNTLTIFARAANPGAVDANFGLTLAFSPPASGVPEPATWAMMLVGFGAAGYSLRRRRSTSVRTQAA